MNTEADVKRMVNRWLDKLKAFHFMPVQSPLGRHGIHDHLACVPIKVTSDMVGRTIGIFVSIEAKRPGRRGEANRGASVPQVKFMEGVRGAYGVSFVCDSEEDLLENWIYDPTYKR